MSDAVNLSTEPLELQTFPVNLRKHVDPRAPLPLRDMGAKGIAPGLAPHELVMILYQLQFDDQVKDAAQKTFKELPDELAMVAAQAELPAPVLDFCARRWLSHRGRLERLLRNPALDDQTVAFIAGKGDDHIAEVVAENQNRLTRTPEIIAQLYNNPKAHQSTLDRVLEFAHRQGVSFEGLPALQKALEANLLDAKLQNQRGQDKKASDAATARLLQESVAKAELEEEQGITADEIEERMDLFKAILEEGGGDEAQAEEAKQAVSRQTAILAMGISEKVRLATLGSREDRAILIRDPNRLVHMSALLSPKSQPRDLKSYAGNKNLPDTVINYISTKRELMRDYTIILALVNNPKLSLATGTRLLVHLRTNDLRPLSRNRNVSPQLAKQAKALLNKRTSGRGGG